ncbi:ATP-binding protein [Gulosibacter macacae]|uniref:ATP-binding protein n=1 Tax=Gulosibacter macacae TaxID=2488791 RepID=UPI002286DE76|nr:ATP-binding protein [Gulosibacter macacae]
MTRNFVPVVPQAALLESLRSLGYDPEVAIADVVDNSISAGASEIEILFDPSDDPKYVSILDDGTGMTSEELLSALTLGAKSSDTFRSESDLGRFGLGLKTASFSQARILTVVSRHMRRTSAYRWDLDRGEWEVENLTPARLKRVPGYERVKTQARGTLVVWENLDDLLHGSEIPSRRIAEVVATTKSHLSRTFHRFLKGGDQSNQINLIVNGVQLTGEDPFLESNPATQVTPVETVELDGHIMKIQGFVLPHADKFREKERKREDLGEGMWHAQGFYFYRNGRLISGGGWGAIRKRSTDSAKHTRVRIDVPNQLDKHWKLDVQKRKVEPPPVLKKVLERMHDIGRAKGEKIITYRGRRKSDERIHFLWEYFEDRGKFRYEINDKHPIIADVLTRLSGSEQRAVRSLLEKIADFLPAEDIYKRMALDSKAFDTSDNDEKITQFTAALIRALDIAAEDVESIRVQVANYEQLHRRRDLEKIIQTALDLINSEKG